MFNLRRIYQVAFSHYAEYSLRSLRRHFSPPRAASSPSTASSARARPAASANCRRREPHQSFHQPDHPGVRQENRHHRAADFRRDRPAREADGIRSALPGIRLRRRHHAAKAGRRAPGRSQVESKSTWSASSRSGRPTLPVQLKGLSILTTPQVTKIAFRQPADRALRPGDNPVAHQREAAPDAVQPKMVQAENINQSLQFAQSRQRRGHVHRAFPHAKHRRQPVHRARRPPRPHRAGDGRQPRPPTPAAKKFADVPRLERRPKNLRRRRLPAAVRREEVG